jgi:hypothetical protein
MPGLQLATIRFASSSSLSCRTLLTRPAGGERGPYGRHLAGISALQIHRRRRLRSAGLALWDVMSNASSRRFPVTVTHLPVMRCEICHRTVAYRPGKASEVLTEHYRRAHPKALERPSR